MVKRRNNIVLIRQDPPKKVTFNGRSFNAHFKRVNKNHLPGSTKIGRTYKGRPVKTKTAKNKQPTYNAAIKRLPNWLIEADLTKTLAQPKSVRKNSYSQAARRLPNWLLRAKPSTNIQRPPWLQKGKGLSDVAKTLVNNPYLQEVSKKIISKGINSIPSLFKKGTNKVKNKRLRSVLQSDIAMDIANDLVDKGKVRFVPSA